MSHGTGNIHFKKSRGRKKRLPSNKAREGRGRGVKGRPCQATLDPDRLQALPGTMGGHRMRNSYTVLAFPSAAPWNKDLTLSRLLTLHMKLTQTPHRNRELGQHWSKSQSPGPTPNPPRKSSQIRFTFTASLTPTMTQRVFPAPQTLFNCSLINLFYSRQRLTEEKRLGSADKMPTKTHSHLILVSQPMSM